MRRPLRPRRACLSSSPRPFRIPLSSPVLSSGGDERIFRSPCPESRRVITGFLTRTLPADVVVVVVVVVIVAVAAAAAAATACWPPFRAHTHPSHSPPLGRRKQACNIDRPRGYLFARLRGGREREREERKRERTGKRGTGGSGEVAVGRGRGVST